MTFLKMIVKDKSIISPDNILKSSTNSSVFLFNISASCCTTGHALKIISRYDSEECTQGEFVCQERDVFKDLCFL